MAFRAAISAGLYGDESASDLATLWLSSGQADPAEAGFNRGELGRLLALKVAVGAGIYNEGRTLRTPFNWRGDS
jgi:hypothetical protein